VKFAEFSIKSAKNTTANKGIVRLHDGNITALEFKRPIEHAEVDDIISIEMKIVDEPYDDDEDLR
jgi:hypothetical protein